MIAAPLRSSALLRRQYRALISYTGFVLALVGAWMLVSLLALMGWPEETGQAWGFIVPGVSALLVGLLTWRAMRPRVPVTLTVREGGVIVVLTWAVACLLGAIPLMWNDHLTFSQAVFESVSGWTTTGLSVVDVSATAHTTLLYRSLLQLAGGAGLAIIMLAAITGPPLGTGLTVAEGRSDQLVPNVRRSAKLVLAIYGGYAALGVLGYLWSGMGFFDAVNHAFTAISTGGFSTRVESIGYWDSPAAEGVSIFLMVLGNINFATAYVLLRGRPRAFVADGEIKVLVAGLAGGTLLLFILTCVGLYPGLAQPFRVALFQATSALTTTGFSTAGYNNWNGVGILVMVVLMLVGGGTGSTAGGIKQQRIYLMSKTVAWELMRFFLPDRAVVSPRVKEGGRLAFPSVERLRRVGTFIFLYLSVFALGTLVLAAHGLSLSDAMFEFSSALGTVGLSVGAVNAHSPAAVLWTDSVAMFLGRLEFFVVVVGLTRLVSDLPRLMGRRDKP